LIAIDFAKIKSLSKDKKYKQKFKDFEQKPPDNEADRLSIEKAAQQILKLLEHKQKEL